MPKDSAPTRSTILAAAVQILQRAGVEGFTLEAVARRAGVVKGLVLYHYASRGRLLKTAAAQIARVRMRHGQGEADGDGGIHRISALLQNLDAHVGRQRLLDGDHAVLSSHGLARATCVRLSDFATK